ncbi:MAG: replicative DNA helicase [Desulfobaccales bacterium]
MPKVSSRFAAAEAPTPVGYTPPANPEAEQSVLGAILVRPEAMDRIADLIAPEDFYREAHGRIYKAMLDLYGRGEPVDLVTVSALLKERGQLEGVGGPVFLAGLSEQVGFATNAEYYASLVRDKAVLRRLLDCAQEIASACLAPVENVAEFLDRAEHKVFQVAEAKVRPGFSPLSALVDNEIATLEAIWGRKDGSLTGVSSGFTDLDNYTAGFQASDLIILAARPSMGKTALALNIAFNAAYGGPPEKPHSRQTPVPVAFFSLEMSKEQLVRRLLSSIGKVDASQIRRATFLTGPEWTKLQEAAGILVDCPIYIDDTPAATVLDIRAKSRRLKADGKLGMVIIDYLQLMQGRPELNSREQQISEISRSLKGLAKELAVPVMALSQLSREPEKRERKRPQLSDLRESGAIEQDADVVIFIYREEVYTKDEKHKGVAEVIFGKQRNGPIGTVKLAFRDRFTRFDDLERDEAPGGY